LHQGVDERAARRYRFAGRRIRCHIAGTNLSTPAKIRERCEVRFGAAPPACSFENVMEKVRAKALSKSMRRRFSRGLIDFCLRAEATLIFK
jgi:hypothetical protein